MLSKCELEKEIKVGLDVMALGVIKETKSVKEIPKEVKSIPKEAVEALSRKHALLTSMQIKVVGFEMVKDPKVRIKGIKKLHEEVCLKTEKQNAKYVEQANKNKKLLVFELGGLVWVHLHNDRFSSLEIWKIKVDGRWSFQHH